MARAHSGMTRSERRDARRRSRERMGMSGAGIRRVYRDAVTKRARRRSK